MKKEVVQQKSSFTAKQFYDFLLYFIFFCEKTVNRKLTFMYLFDLNMSNIKSEALAQECPKRKVFWKILQSPLKIKKFAKYLRTPFENTNNTIEHLGSRKMLFVNCW